MSNTELNVVELCDKAYAALDQRDWQQVTAYATTGLLSMLIGAAKAFLPKGTFT